MVKAAIKPALKIGASLIGGGGKKKKQEQAAPAPDFSGLMTPVGQGIDFGGDDIPISQVSPSVIDSLNNNTELIKMLNDLNETTKIDEEDIQVISVRGRNT